MRSDDHPLGTGVDSQRGNVPSGALQVPNVSAKGMI